MNASSFVYIDVVIICTMMSFYQQILHSFSCYNVLCIGNLTYAGHFAVCPSMPFVLRISLLKVVVMKVVGSMKILDNKHVPVYQA